MSSNLLTTSNVSPPYQLEGLKLDDGWTVGAIAQKEPCDTGGHFSAGYACQSDSGTQAFLKAIDLYTPLAHRGGNVLGALQPLIEVVQGERALLHECKRMDRVVKTIAQGDIYELNGQQLFIPVPYIIFERADHTARRIILGSSTRPPHSWCLRTLHQVAVGMWQLHGSMIAHQDLKLSNILMFPESAGAKIADLGRAIQQGRAVAHDALAWPGDNAYAPPEYLYSFTPSEFNVRRLASDLYLLGSCACQIFTGAAINALLIAELPVDIKPVSLSGTYSGAYKDALPHIHDAFERVLSAIHKSLPDDPSIRIAILKAIREWCNPDPDQRGHPTTRGINATSGNAYSLERYLSQLDNLANRVRISERRSSSP